MFYHRETRKLTAAHEQTLKQQTIAENSPGTILQDFDTLIHFAGEKSIPVTGTHLLPLNLLKPLNERLSQPIELGLKRPQQKSYPHINGLYLLLRAIGLAQIDMPKTKPHLGINVDILRSWTHLNPTERYLTLLETWIIRGKGEIVGEPEGSFWGDAPIVNWDHFFKKIPPTGLSIAGDSNAEDAIRFTPKLYNLALLELFGLLTVERGPVVARAGWQIERVWRTPLGDALLALIATYLNDHLKDIFGYGDPSEVPFGVLQPAIQPYFPEWQNNLTIPGAEFQDGLYIFKVSWSRVWRRIAIPATMTLDQFGSIILDAYEFDHDHLDEFIYTNRFGSTKRIYHFDMEEPPATDEVHIGDLPLQPGAAMIYHFDFGDNWRFEVILEKIKPVDPKITRPVILEKFGPAPSQYGW